VLKNPGRLRKIAGCQGLNEFRDGNPNRASLHARPGLALKTAFSLTPCLFKGYSKVYLFKGAASEIRIAFGHMYPVNGYPFFG
jgi:hypothetical protein